MSLVCQTEQLRCCSHLGDIVRQVSVEAKLTLPDGYPKIVKVKGGECRTAPPVLTILEDVLIVSGKLYPQLVYLAEQPLTEEHRYGKDNPGDDTDDFTPLPQAPSEYGYIWPDEHSIIIEEQIEVPGLTPDMFVELDVKMGSTLYEKESHNEVVFHGIVDLVVHTATPQSFEIISDIVTQPAGRANVTKEQVTFEEQIIVKTLTVPIRSSLLLPNFKPAVDRLLDYSVRPVGVNTEFYNGKIAIKGTLEVAVVYVGCDEEGRPTEIFMNDWNRENEAAIPFETFLDHNASSGRVLVEPKITARNLRLENRTQRELNCQMDLECEVKISQLVTKDVVVDVSPGSGELLDTEKYLLNVEEFVEEHQGTIDFELSVNLQPGLPDVERALSHKGLLEDFRVEASDNKVFLEGNLCLWLYYVADGMENQRLFHAGWEKRNGNGLSVAGSIDCPMAGQGAVLRSRVALDVLKMETTGARTLKVQGTIKVTAIVKKPRAIIVIKNCAIVTPVDPATRPSMLFYIVQPGDTLWKIARRYQTTVEVLARVNQVPNPDRVDGGQKLLIPKTVHHCAK